MLTLKKVDNRNVVVNRDYLIKHQGRFFASPARIAVEENADGTPTKWELCYFRDNGARVSINRKWDEVDEIYEIVEG